MIFVKFPPNSLVLYEGKIGTVTSYNQKNQEYRVAFKEEHFSAIKFLSLKEKDLEHYK